MSYGFCSKFDTLSGSAKIFNQLRFDKVTEFKGRNFFTQNLRNYYHQQALGLITQKVSHLVRIAIQPKLRLLTMQ